MIFNLVEIFIPPKLGRRSMYTQTVLGISVEYGQVRGALVKHLLGGQIVVEKVITQEFKINDSPSRRFSYDKESLQEAIAKIVAQLGQLNDVRIVISSYTAVCKELTLPFVDSEKIAMVLPFQAEPLLPFAQSDCSMAFCKTQLLPDGSAKVLAAAVRDQDLAKLLAISRHCNLSVNALVLDVMVLYQAILDLPESQQAQQGILFISWGQRDILQGFILNGALQGMRHFDFGWQEVAEFMAKRAKVDVEKVLQVIALGSVEAWGSVELDRAWREFWRTIGHEVTFAAQTFLLASQADVQQVKLMVVDPVYNVQSWSVWGSEVLQLTALPFPLEVWLKTRNLKNKAVVQIEGLVPYIKAIGVTMSGSVMQDFHLERKLFDFPEQSLLKKQLTVVLGLLAFLVFNQFWNASNRLNRLQAIIAEHETKMVEQLKPILPSDYRIPKRIVLTKLVNDAVTNLQALEQRYNQFSYKVPDFLKNFIELTRAVDAISFGTKVDSLIFKPDATRIFNITLSGSLTHHEGDNGSNSMANFYSQLQVCKGLELIEPASPVDMNSNKFNVTFKVLEGANVR